MTKSPHSLQQSLASSARSLPAAELDVESVIATGRKRRIRRRAAGSALSLAAAAIVALVAAPMLSNVLSNNGLNTRSNVEPAADDGSRDSPVADESGLAESEGPATLRVEPVEPVDDQQPRGEPTPDGVRVTSDVIGSLPSTSVLFWADHEECEQLEDPRHHPQWSAGQQSDQLDASGQPTYGFAYNTGRLGVDLDWRFSSQDPVVAGTCGLSIDLLTADSETSAVRLFRRYDVNGDPLPADGFYSTWLYIPADVVLETTTSDEGSRAAFWTIMQLKNVVQLEAEEGSDASTESLSAFSVTAGRSSDETSMRLSIHNKVPCGLVEDCPQAVSIMSKDEVTIPTGQWFHLELGWMARSDESGELGVWLDGEQIVEYEGPTERPNNVQRTWNLASSGRQHLNTPHSMFVDDVLISTEPVSPLLFGS